MDSALRGVYEYCGVHKEKRVKLMRRIGRLVKAFKAKAEVVTAACLILLISMLY